MARWPIKWYKIVKLIQYSFFEADVFIEITNVEKFQRQRFPLICEALRNLVAFVQFKKREKHPWRSVNFSKVAGYHIYTNSSTLSGLVLDRWSALIRLYPDMFRFSLFKGANNFVSNLRLIPLDINVFIEKRIFNNIFQRSEHIKRHSKIPRLLGFVSVTLFLRENLFLQWNVLLDNKLCSSFDVCYWLQDFFIWNNFQLAHRQICS